MKKPLSISIGLFLFLFGLAFAKAAKLESVKKTTTPSITKIKAE